MGGLSGGLVQARGRYADALKLPVRSPTPGSVRPPSRLGLRVSIQPTRLVSLARAAHRSSASVSVDLLFSVSPACSNDDDDDDDDDSDDDDEKDDDDGGGGRPW